MDILVAIEALASLSQASRLNAFKLLVHHEPEGLPAGEVAQMLDVPQNTISSHLGILQRAGLVQAKRQESDADAFIAQVTDALGQDFGFDYVTLQLETAPCERAGACVVT